MSLKKIHSIIFGNNNLPLTTIVCQAQIYNTDRQFKINSISWDWQAWVAGSQVIIPFHENITQRIQLVIQPISGAQNIAQPFINPTPLAGVNNGVSINFYSPGKRNFDNFFFSNDLNIVFTQANLDVLNRVYFYTSIVIEIEDVT